MTSFDMLWRKLLYSELFRFEESLVRDTILHYKDCNEMHSGSCSKNDVIVKISFFPCIAILVRSQWQRAKIRTGLKREKPVWLVLDF